jgi:hypothetical protein
MKTFRELIEEQLKQNRPKLSDSSLKTYISILYNLHKHMKVEDETLSYFDSNSKEILEYLKDFKPQTRKSILSALYILTNNEEYRKIMLEDCNVVNNQYKEQKKSIKETDGWINIDEIKTIYHKLLENVQQIFSQKTIVNYSTIIEFFLLMCLGGVSGIPPRRSLDYALMKTKDYDTKTDNYYKNGKFYFNKYKTAEKYGLQVIDIPKDLIPLIKKWIKINPTDYLLFSSNKNRLSSSQITRMLNKILGKKTSTDILRHIYLTNYYKDVPAILNMEKLATDMGHSVNTAMQYVKK